MALSLLRKSLCLFALVLLLAATGCEKETPSPPEPQARAPKPLSPEQAAAVAKADKLLAEWEALKYPAQSNTAPSFGQKLAAIGPLAVPSVARLLIRSNSVTWSRKLAGSFLEAMGQRAIEPLQTLLDELTGLRQEALAELTAHELNEDQAAGNFLAMSHALSDKINAKISRQRLDKRFAELAAVLRNERQSDID